MSLISTEQLAVRLGGREVLHNVDLSIAPGEIVTIVGPNGSGKSNVVARELLGVVAPSTGRVTRQPGLRIGYVPQKLHIDPTMPMPVARFLSLPTAKARRAWPRCWRAWACPYCRAGYDHTLGRAVPA